MAKKYLYVIGWSLRAPIELRSRLGIIQAPGAHIGIKAGTGGLTRDSVVLLEQVRTLDKRRLRERAGQIDPDVQRRVDEALEISFGLETF